MQRAFGGQRESCGTDTYFNVEPSGKRTVSCCASFSDAPAVIERIVVSLEDVPPFSTHCWRRR